MNLLMIAKSYQKLKDNENTIKYLKMTREYPVKTLDDEQVRSPEGNDIQIINYINCRFYRAELWQKTTGAGVAIYH